MKQIIKDLIRVSRTESNLKLADDYLSTRKLNLWDEVGFISVFPYGDSMITNSIVMVTKDILGDVVSVETRNASKKVYNKVYYNKNSIPVYGMHKFKKQPKIILTESIINAESINQNFSDECLALSLNGIGVNRKSKMYFLLTITAGSKIYLAFDNDEAGVSATTEFIKVAKSKFNRDIDIIDYPCDDVNRFLVKKGVKLFKEVIGRQLV